MMNFYDNKENREVNDMDREIEFLDQFIEWYREQPKPEVKLLDTDKYDATIDIKVDADAKDPGLYMKAQAALVEYLEGDRSEESFGELAKKYSSDGNASTGGLYTGVTEGYMVEEFENWSLQEGRQPGDVGIVETNYGYHIMYHVKKDVVTSWQGIITENCVYEDVLAFTDALSEGYTSEVDGYKDGYNKVVKESIDALVKSNLEYYNTLIDEVTQTTQAADAQ